MSLFNNPLVLRTWRLAFLLLQPQILTASCGVGSYLAAKTSGKEGANGYRMRDIAAAQQALKAN